MPPTLAPNSRVTEYKVVADTWTTVAAADVVPTGLKKLVSVVATLASDLVDDPMHVSVIIPATGGTFTLKTWQNTSGSDPTPVAATTFGKVVSWIAFGY